MRKREAPNFLWSNKDFERWTIVFLKQKIKRKLKMLIALSLKRLNLVGKEEEKNQKKVLTIRKIKKVRYVRV